MDEACCLALSRPLQPWHLSLSFFSHPELYWNTIVSSETIEIVSFGSGDKFQTRQDCLVLGWGGGGEYCQARQASSSSLEVGWGWRKFSNETNEIISYGGGAGAHSIQTSWHHISQAHWPALSVNPLVSELRGSSSIHIYRGSQNIIDIWSDKHGKWKQRSLSTLTRMDCLIYTYL